MVIKNKLYESKSEQKKVLSLARKFGINKIDTAQRYGSSEKNIGLNKSQFGKKFFIISKFDLEKFDKENISFIFL